MTAQHRTTLIASLAAALLASACTGKTPEAPAAAKATAPVEAAPEAAPTITPAARDEANQIFATRCTPCHGPQGMGNGPASASLSPKPRNFTDATWQAKVDDDHIEKIIQYGGASVGLSAAMPANPDLTSKPEVVAALREHIRSFNSSKK